jgi:hypothetical protein
MKIRLVSCGVLVLGALFGALGVGTASIASAAPTSGITQTVRQTPFPQFPPSPCRKCHT